MEGSYLKIAYLLLAHNKPNHLVRLVNKLNDGLVSFIIHYDLSSDLEEFNFLKEVFKEEANVHFVEKRVKGFWGDFSLVRATLECIKYMYEQNVDYDYAFLISGQDFPLKTNSEILEFIRNNKGKQFIHAEKIPTSFWEYGGIDRLEYFHFNSFKKNETMKKICFKITTKLLKILKVKRKRPNLDFYGGSQWWCLSREFLNYTLEYIEANKSFTEFFKYAHVPDEIFFQTLLMNSPYKEDFENISLTYIDWDRAEKPAIFRKTDFDLLTSLDNYFLFARKFDGDIDEEIIDMLDKHISEKEKTIASVK